MSPVPRRRQPAGTRPCPRTQRGPAPPAANPGLLNHAHAQKIRPSAKDLPALRPAIHLAQEVGEGVGRGEILL
nr:hypothetical protein [Acidovorax sp. 69]